MLTMIWETAVQLLTEIVLSVVGIAAAWLLAKLAQNQRLSSISRAVEEAAGAARVTVLELQQTVVEGWKAASSDGKLSDEEVRQLGIMLLRKTMEKISGPAKSILAAAGTDLTAIIRGEAEAFIQRMKEQRG